jgi:DNA-binding PadR family transcriptional regulator
MARKKRADIQNLTKSCNEVLVMSFLKDGPKHGYQLALHSEGVADGYFRFKYGTLYPILHKLEKQGLIKGIWSDEGPRGKRKSYCLTKKGHARLEKEETAWREFIERFTEIIGEDIE